VSKPTDLVQGTLDLLVLKVIALEPMHGWAISQRIQQMSSENNRRAKYYKLTRAGRKALEQEAAQWERLSAAISLIVRAV
jgi:PadR family transcriptional regulator, regulatory protein PadR